MDLLTEVKQLSKELRSKISLESLMVGAFNNCPYPCWIKIPDRGMIINKALINNSDISDYRLLESGVILKSFLLTMNDQEVMLGNKNVKMFNRVSNGYEWSGWKLPLSYQGNTFGVAGLATSWNKV